MDITQLEKEILKAIDVERNILKKFIKKCFKEHNQENQKFIDALYKIENRKEEK